MLMKLFKFLCDKKCRRRNKFSTKQRCRRGCAIWSLLHWKRKTNYKNSQQDPCLPPPDTWCFTSLGITWFMDIPCPLKLINNWSNFPEPIILSLFIVICGFHLLFLSICYLLLALSEKKTHWSIEVKFSRSTACIEKGNTLWEFWFSVTVFHYLTFSLVFFFLWW